MEKGHGTLVSFLAETPLFVVMNPFWGTLHTTPGPEFSTKERFPTIHTTLLSLRLQAA
jgi:hypothetical protein